MRQKRTPEDNVGRHYGIARGERFEARHLTPSALKRKRSKSRAARKARRRQR